MQVPSLRNCALQPLFFLAQTFKITKKETTSKEATSFLLPVQREIE
jgi:hypothetical protein